MSKFLFIDFETFYSTKDGYTLSKVKGFSQMSTLEYVRDERFKVFGVGYAWEDGEPHWIHGDPHILTAFFKSIDWDDTVVVAHNAKFDGSILEWHYGYKAASYIDTVGLSRAVLGSSVPGHSLMKLAEHFQLPSKGIMQTDGLRDLTTAQEKDLADYCKHDVWLCRQIYNRLIPFFPDNQLWDLDWTIKAFLRPKLVLDEAVLTETYYAERERRETIFEEIKIDKTVFSSNKKFSELLLARGYEIPTKLSPRTGKSIPALALGDEGFLDLVNSGNTELEALCEARIAAKSTLLETRSEKLLALTQLGAFPFDIHFSGALQTHRYSGGNGAGGNPQNFKKNSGLRRAVAAPRGYCLLVADFSAIEARIVAWLAGEPKLIELFKSGGDPYCDFATVLYKRTITKADKDERAFGKEAILGLGYGMGWEKFQKRVKIKLGKVLTDVEAKEAVNTYRRYYPRIKLLWERLDSVINALASGGSAVIPGVPFIKIENKFIVLPSGLKLQYPCLGKNEDGEWQYKVYTKGHQETRHLYGAKLLENISQALAGEILKLAIKSAEKGAIHCYGSIHDEILAVVIAEYAGYAAEMLGEHMTYAAQYFWPDIKLNVEIGIGNNWLEAKH